MQNQIRRLIQLAIEEDLGSGDITSELTVPPEIDATGYLYVKEDCVLCGTVMVDLIFEELGWPVLFESDFADGDYLKEGTVFGRLQGCAQYILSAERIILNFLQHLSGVATKARELVEAAEGLTVLDTRKTTPAWRILEKYAARIGGMRSHRESLSDMILIKNNHIDVNAGDLNKILKRVMEKKPIYMPVEVEVRNMKELLEAVKGGAEIVMLDNMEEVALRDALNWLEKNAPTLQVEVSGRVNSDKMQKLVKLGVKCVSTSAMVTAATWVDIALRLEVDQTLEDS
ncbi:MAG: carboxylating nicotinate-nucleotide diphosphorylase [Bdellovibrionota bacterium]|jgi:nicotinate-nucleotide pyrophosphorylase (carboxylating)